jgi:hypothetical protein
MRGRMGLTLIAVAMFAVACQTPAQKEHKKQMQEEKKMAQAEAKRQKEVAAAEAKHQKEEAKAQAEENKRMAEENKRIAAENKKKADEQAKADAKYEKDNKEAFGAESFRDERDVRSVDRFLLAQSAAGAKEDAMLSDDHFDGNELNELGKTKMKLIAHARHAGSTEPVIVYINSTDTKATDARHAAVESYWKASVWSDVALNVKNGVNDNLSSPAKPNLDAMKRMNEEKKMSQTGAMNTPAVSGTAGPAGTP